MGRTIHSIIRISGITLIIEGFAMILTFIVSLLCGEWREGMCFLWIGAAVCVAGFLSRILCKGRAKSLPLGDGFLIVVILWFLMSLLGALPYLATGTISHPVDAIFESTSGFTSTGATCLDHLHTLPHGILFWRSMTCWLGGIGIILLAVTLMPALGLNGQRLNTPDNFGPILEQFTPKMMSSLRTICLIYGGATLLETILLTLSGMSLFNGLLHSMSTLSTGGFGRYDDSIAHFDGCAIPLIISAFMIFSGLNYFLLLGRPRNGLRTFLRNSEVRLYGLLLVASTVLITAIMTIKYMTQDNSLHLEHTLYAGPSLGDTLTHALFQSASFLTTNGFISTDYGIWPQFCQTMLLLLMMCGACTGSAGSGLKVARVSILLKLIRHGISTRLHANYFETVKMNGQGMPSETVSGVATMPFLYIAALFTGTFLLTFDNIPMSTAFNAAQACLCNTGHAFGILGPGTTFADFSAAAKGLMSLLMVGGRLELYAIVILMTPKYWVQGH